MKLKNILGFSVGPLGAALLGFISLPILAWYFSPEDIGRLSILQVVISFSVILCSLGLDQAYVREFHEVTDKPALLKVAVFPGLLILLLVCFGVFVYSPQFISQYLFSINSSYISLIVIFCLISAYLSRFLSLILRMKEKGLAFSMSQLLPKLLFLVIIGSYVYSKSILSFNKLLIAQFLSIILVLIVYLWNTRLEWIPAIAKKIDFYKLRDMLNFGLPLVFGGIASWTLTAMDRIFLRGLSSFGELGIYSIAVSIGAAAGIVSGIFNTIWAPIVFKWSAEGKDLNKILVINNYALIVVYFVLCLTGIFSWLIPYVLPKSYESVQFLVVGCMIVPLFYLLSEISGVGITLSRKTKFSLIASLVAAVVNAIGNYLLIPSYGANGAVAATAIAFWVFLVCRTEFSFIVWRKAPRAQLYIITFLCLICAVWYAILGVKVNNLGFVPWLALFFLGLYIFKPSIHLIWLDVNKWLLKKKYNC